MKNIWVLAGLLAALSATAAPGNAPAELEIAPHYGDNGGDRHGHGDGGKDCHRPWRRFGAPGMGGFYDHGWDHPGHVDGDFGGHKGGHKGGHTGGWGKHGDLCPDPNSVDDTLQEILDNPTVEVNETLPLVSDNGTVADMVDSEVVPTVNVTAPILGEGELPALMNSSTGGDATAFGGISSGGMSEEIRPPQGTNANADVFDSSLSSSSGMMARRRSPQAYAREMAAASRRQVTVNSQPDLPKPKKEEDEPDANKRCEYGAYKHVLGGDGSASLGALWALEGYVDLVAADVRQGGIGDCGLGASVMALASGGWTGYLKKRFQRVGAGEGSYEVRLAKDGAEQVVAIDDQLPVLTGGSTLYCWPYPGFQPVNDAALPSEDGSYPPTPIFFMPLLEKAFAKFLDANPDWKSTGPEMTGYLGLEGINPAYALAALTGGTPKFVHRATSGFDTPILAALLTCMMGTAPCVIGTTNATTLGGLGTPDTTSTIWLNPTGDRAVNKGYTPGETAGLAASDAPVSNSTYTIIDFDQVVKTDKGDRSTAITLVGTHAYALDHSQSTDWPMQTSVKSLIEARMAILNPWGSNPCSWPGGGCGKDGGLYPMPSKVPLSFRALAQTIYSVYTVENMPPL